MTKRLDPIEKEANRIEREMRGRTEMCPECGGIGEKIGWVNNDADWIGCGWCKGYGCVRPEKPAFPGKRRKMMT